LELRYGRAAAERAIKELRDTVFRDQGSSDGLRFFLRRAPNYGTLDGRNCPRVRERQPKEIDGIRTDEEPHAPRISR